VNTLQICCAWIASCRPTDARRWCLALLLLAGVGSAQAEEGGQWVTPSGFEDPTGLWMDPSLAYDGSAATYASDTSNAAGDGPWLVLDYQPSIHCSQIRLIADYGYEVVDAVALEGRVQGVWTPLFNGGIDNDSAFIITFPSVDADAFRFRFHYLTSGYYFWLYDFSAYRQPVQVVAPLVATLAASAVTATSAVLHGQVVSDGGSPCAVAFQYRAAGGGPTITTAWTPGVTTGQGANAVLMPVAGLQTGVTYSYHLIATTAAVTVTGEDRSFTPQPLVAGSGAWIPGIDVHPDSTTEMSWVSAASAIDDDPITAARCYHPLWVTTASPAFDVTLPEIATDSVRLMAGRNAYIEGVSVWLQATGSSAWTPLYSGPFSDATWLTLPLPQPGLYAQARVVFTTTTTAVGTAWELGEIQVHVPESSLVNQPPTIALAAAATPAAVTAASTDLAVRGADDGGEAALTYTWTVTGPDPVTVPANGTHAASSATVAFTATGTYQATVRITDAQGLSVVSPAVAVAVQSLKDPVISPDPIDPSQPPAVPTVALEITSGLTGDLHAVVGGESQWFTKQDAITVHMTVGSGAGETLDRIALTVDGATLDGATVTAIAQATWRVTDLPEGRHELGGTASVSLNGQSATGSTTAPLVLIVDRTPPVLTWEVPVGERRVANQPEALVDPAALF